LRTIPVGIAIHNIELNAGPRGRSFAAPVHRATLMSRDAGYAQIRLPSGEIRRVQEDC
jgi:large subunit ribosomal protein L2